MKAGTFAALVAPFLRHARLRLKRRTWINRRSQLRQIAAGGLGPRQLDAVTEEHLDAYVRQQQRRGKKSTTINAELRAYGGLRKWAASTGRAVGAAPVELPERPAFDVRSWSPVEVRRLYGALARVSPSLLPVVVCIVNAGLRRGEALALRWSRVDLGRRLLQIWPSDEWQPKSGRPREVPINDALLELLLQLPRRGDYVFTSRKGRRWAYWPQRAFDRARGAAGLSGGPHRLRHTYAAEFLARGGSLSQLAQILGHSDERVTRLYGHLRPEHLAELRNVAIFPVSTGQRRRTIAERISALILNILQVMRSARGLDGRSDRYDRGYSKGAEVRSPGALAPARSGR